MLPSNCFKFLFLFFRFTCTYCEMLVKRLGYSLTLKLLPRFFGSCNVTADNSKIPAK